MTPEENEVLELLADAWGKFLKLPTQHASDIPDFLKAIHDAQRIVLVRPEIRKFPPVLIAT